MDILSSLSQTWKGLTASQRLFTVVLTIAAIGVLAGISYFGNRTEYRSLAVGDPTKIGEIATNLESVGIKPKVSGTGIMVPVDRFDEAVLAIARNGLNIEGVGFELLDKGTNAFTTSLLERVTVQRAVAGELERILRSYPGIAAARVIISQDKEGWRAPDKDGTASVSLTLKPGVAFGASDVAAVQACVANAWHSLKTENVSVNANGRRLSREVMDSSDRQFAQSSLQLSAQTEFEETLRRRVQELLDHSQGAGKTHITVSAELNFDSKSEKTHTVDPDKIAARREEIHDSTKTNGDSSSAGGVTGVTANTPGEAKGGGSGDFTKNSDKTTNAINDVSFTDRLMEKRGFEVKRLSIALFVDQSLKTRLPDIEKTVKTAVGFDDSRNDQFSATAEAEFAKPLEETTPLAPVTSNNLFELVTTGGRIAALVSLVILFLFVLKRAGGSSKGKKLESMAQNAAAVRQPAAMGDMATQITNEQPHVRAAASPVGDVAVGSDRSPEEIARQTIAKSAAAAAASDPAAAGRVVRGWLEEKRR